MGRDRDKDLEFLLLTRMGLVNTTRNSCIPLLLAILLVSHSQSLLEARSLKKNGRVVPNSENVLSSLIKAPVPPSGVSPVTDSESVFSSLIKAPVPPSGVSPILNSKSVLSSLIKAPVPPSSASPIIHPHGSN